MHNISTANSKPFKVLTANVRVSEAQDGENGWEFRKQFCLDTLLAQNADVICGQEVSPTQFADLSESLADYDSYALPESPTSLRPQNAIFYRRDRFSLVAASGYWLSESPHVPGTRSWGSSCIRFANWVRLADRLNHKRGLRIINTHLDHISHEARINQARVLAEDANAYPDDFPQVLTGDFNCDGTTEPLATLRDGGWIDSYGAIHGTETPGHTYHAFNGSAYEGQVDKMDWVMMRGALAPQSAAIVMDADEGRYPSDHYFVSGAFTFI